MEGKLTTEDCDLKLYDIFERPPMIGITRGHSYRIKPERPNTAAYAGSFLVRPVREWNSLDASLFRWNNSCAFQVHLADYFQKLTPG